MGDGPIIRSFFDEATNTVSHLVADPHTGAAAIIDPVLDFDSASGKVGAASAEKLLTEADKEGWCVCWVLETHAHADHLSAAQFVKERTGAHIAIGASAWIEIKTMVLIQSTLPVDGPAEGFGS